MKMHCLFLLFIFRELLADHDICLLDFRYFMRVLLPKNAILAEAVPPFFLSWLQKDSNLCMFTFEQLKKFKATHLEAGEWYLDYHRNYIPESEVVERTTLDGGQLALLDLDDA